MLFSDTVIDMVQSGKKSWVNTFVTNEQIADAMNTFIDTQTDYTKQTLKATTEASTKLTQETVKAFTNLTKFDYSKFGEGIMKAYTATQAKK